jgi:predicted adenine nucleotide alpha hydrolase (AANH) superfamily ATPase
MSKGPQNLLLHVCCAPCAAGCADRLPGEWTPTLFFSNSNIASPDEHERRLKEVRKLADILCLTLVEDVYDHADWLKAVAGLEGEPEGGARCKRCFRYRLERTAARLADLECSKFTTTLTVSPHKKSPDIFAAGRECGPFLELDFKKRGGYEHSVAMSLEYRLYRQKTCGCEFTNQRETKA